MKRRKLVTDALLRAVWRRGKPDALLHHSDQGSQYTSEQVQRLMADHGTMPAMESFFSSLKTEHTANKICRTRDEARADVFDYIERFYNTPAGTQLGRKWIQLANSGKCRDTSHSVRKFCTPRP